MSSITPGQPIPEYRPQQSQSEDKKSENQRLNEEIALAAVSAFLSGVMKESGRSGDPSKNAKVNKTKDDLKSGTITTGDAITNLNNILNDLLKGDYGNIPDLISNIKDSSGLSIDYIRFFQFFTDYQARTKNTNQEEIVGKADKLIEKIESKEITPSNAIVELNSLIQKANDSNPKESQFPTINPSLF